MMKDESKPSTRRILSSIHRLRRDGETLLRERPLDEIAHAKWTDRADKYLRKRMPNVHIAPPYELEPVTIPNFLDPSYRPSHPMDSALARTEAGKRLAQKYLSILASAQERLELKLETEEN